MHKRGLSCRTGSIADYYARTTGTWSPFSKATARPSSTSIPFIRGGPGAQLPALPRGRQLRDRPHPQPTRTSKTGRGFSRKAPNEWFGIPRAATQLPRCSDGDVAGRRLNCLPRPAEGGFQPGKQEVWVSVPVWHLHMDLPKEMRGWARGCPVPLGSRLPCSTGQQEWRKANYCKPASQARPGGPGQTSYRPTEKHRSSRGPQICPQLVGPGWDRIQGFHKGEREEPLGNHQRV